MKSTTSTPALSAAWPECPDHAWCWGSCVLPNQPKSVPIEHRTYFRTVHPAEQLAEPRRDQRRAISAAMTALDDGPPLVSVRIHTARRDLEVRLTFQEVARLSADLWAAAAAVSREADKDTKLLRCPRCRITFHPSALGWRDVCRDCGVRVHEVGTRAQIEAAEMAADEVNTYGRGVPKVECRDCDCCFHPDSSPHLDRCWECAERVDGVTV